MTVVEWMADLESKLTAVAKAQAAIASMAAMPPPATAEDVATLLAWRTKLGLDGPRHLDEPQALRRAAERALPGNTAAVNRIDAALETAERTLPAVGDDAGNLLHLKGDRRRMARGRIREGVGLASLLPIAALPADHPARTWVPPQELYRDHDQAPCLVLGKPFRFRPGESGFLYEHLARSWYEKAAVIAATKRWREDQARTDAEREQNELARARHEEEERQRLLNEAPRRMAQRIAELERQLEAARATAEAT
jgi:hypothetical protein